MTDSPSTVVPHYPSRQGLVKREIAIVFGGITILLAVACAAWYLLINARSPAAVVRDFIEFDRAGQFTRQQELVTDGWDSRMALSIFQSMRQQSGSSPFQNYKIVGRSESHTSTAYVDVEITLPPPSIPILGALTSQPAGPKPPNIKMMVNFVLTRQGDDWKIESGQTLASVISALVSQGFQQFQSNPPTLPSFGFPPIFPNLGIPQVAPPSSGPNSNPPPAGSPTI